MCVGLEGRVGGRACKEEWAAGERCVWVIKVGYIDW